MRKTSLIATGAATGGEVKPTGERFVLKLVSLWKVLFLGSKHPINFTFRLVAQGKLTALLEALLLVEKQSQPGTGLF